MINREKLHRDDQPANESFQTLLRIALAPQHDAHVTAWVCYWLSRPHPLEGRL